MIIVASTKIATSSGPLQPKFFTGFATLIQGTEYPSNITRHISAMLVDSDECQKAKTVNTSRCNEAHFWCKELVDGPVPDWDSQYHT